MSVAGLQSDAAFRPGDRLSLGGALGLAWSAKRADMNAAVAAFSALSDSLTAVLRERSLEARVSIQPPPGGTGPVVVSLWARPERGREGGGTAMDDAMALLAAFGRESHTVSPHMDGRVVEAAPIASSEPDEFKLSLRVLQHDAPEEHWP